MVGIMLSYTMNLLIYWLISYSESEIDQLMVDAKNKDEKAVQRKSVVEKMQKTAARSLSTLISHANN